MYASKATVSKNLNYDNGAISNNLSQRIIDGMIAPPHRLYIIYGRRANGGMLGTCGKIEK